MILSLKSHFWLQETFDKTCVTAKFSFVWHVFLRNFLAFGSNFPRQDLLWKIPRKWSALIGSERFVCKQRLSFDVVYNKLSRETFQRVKLEKILSKATSESKLCHVTRSFDLKVSRSASRQFSSCWNQAFCSLCLELSTLELRSFRPPTSPFGQSSQFEYSCVLSLHRWHFGLLSGWSGDLESISQSINQSKHISIAPYVASESEAPHSLRDPAVESERFRRDLKMHLFATH